MKRKAFYGGTFLLLLCILAGVFWWNSSRTAPQTIAWINDIPVDWREAALFAADAEDMESMKDAVNELIWYKILQQKMVEKGELGDSSYTYFLEELEQVNANRRKQKEQGQVLYGPEQYTEKLYYAYRMEQYEEKWQHSVVVSADEKVLRAMYEEHPDWYTVFGDAVFQYLSFEQQESAEDMRALQRFLTDEVRKGSTFQEAARKKGYGNSVTERTFTEQDLTEPDITAYPEIEEVVRTLKAGEVSPLITLNHQYLVFFCLERTEGRRIAFEECREAIREIYVGEYREKIKEKECGSARIVYAFTQEESGTRRSQR